MKPMYTNKQTKKVLSTFDCRETLKKKIISEIPAQKKQLKKVSFPTKKTVPHLNV